MFLTRKIKIERARRPNHFFFLLNSRFRIQKINNAHTITSANMIMNAVPPTLMMVTANIVNATTVSNKIVVKIILNSSFHNTTCKWCENRKRRAEAPLYTTQFSLLKNTGTAKHNTNTNIVASLSIIIGIAPKITTITAKILFFNVFITILL